MKCLKIEFESPQDAPRRRVSIYMGEIVLNSEVDTMLDARRLGVLHLTEDEATVLLQLIQDGAFQHQMQQFEAGTDPVVHVIVAGRETVEAAT